MDLHAPVDVVYLWVDGGDPVWRQKLRHAETRLGVGQRRAHPGITVIDHRALIPAAALPTFDSGNIESYIHRIPNLWSVTVTLTTMCFLARCISFASTTPPTMPTPATHG